MKIQSIHMANNQAESDKHQRMVTAIRFLCGVLFVVFEAAIVVVAYLVFKP